MFSNVLKVYPNLKIKFKDESTLMKFLGVILFFHKDFMTKYSTSIGSSIYFPSRQWLKEDPYRSYAIMCHELTHLFDGSRLGRLVFESLYLFPQILALLFFPLYHYQHHILAYISLLFLLPIPSITRIIFERRAYLSQLYAMYVLKKKYNYNVDLDMKASTYGELFNSLDYYYMSPFSLRSNFENALMEIRAGNKPYGENNFFLAFDNILSNISEDLYYSDEEMAIIDAGGKVDDLI